MNRTELLFKEYTKDKSDRLVFPINFHPNNVTVTKVIKKHFGILESDGEVADLFEGKPPMVAFRRDKNLKDLLVRSRLPTKKECGTKKCDRTRCHTCDHVSQNLNIIGPRGSYEIRTNFTCTSAELIYAIECKKCGQLYVGETCRRLGDRFVEHRRNVINENEDNEVACHFNQTDHHGIDDMLVMGLKYQPGTFTRKLEEQRIIGRLGCVLGQGMNVDFNFPELLN